MSAPNYMKPRTNPQDREKEMGNMLDVTEKPAESGFPRSLLVLFFSVPKVGKSTAAASFPNPLFIDIDDGLSRLTAKRAGNKVITSWEEVDLLGYQLAKNPGHGYQTVVVDTVNGLYRLCEVEMCRRLGISGAGQDKKVLAQKGLGFGEDWTLIRKLFFSTVMKYHALGRKQGFHVVLTGHAKPDALESANRTVDIPGAGARELLSKVELICYLRSDRRTGKDGRSYPVRLLSFSSLTGLQECGSRFPEMDGLDDVIIEQGAFNTIRRTWEKRATEIGSAPANVPAPVETPAAPDPEPDVPLEPSVGDGTEDHDSSSDDEYDDDEFGVQTTPDKPSNTAQPEKPPIVTGEGRQRDADFRPDSDRTGGDTGGAGESESVDVLNNEALVIGDDPRNLEILIQQVLSLCNNAGISKDKFFAGVKKNFDVDEATFLSWTTDDTKNEMGTRAIAAGIKTALLSSLRSLGRWDEDTFKSWLTSWEDHTDFEK